MAPFDRNRWHGQTEIPTGYGDYLISDLSRYLSDLFGKGFSEANLKNMRQFYSVFPDYNQSEVDSVLATQCVACLAWTNIRLIMRLNNPKERVLYC